MSSPLTPKRDIQIDTFRCPASQCVCGKGGGALLCRMYRNPKHIGDVLHVACPKSKSTIIEIVVGGEVPRG